MLIRNAGLLLVICTTVAAMAEEPKKSDPKPVDGWIDLMKPEAWKKVDPGWIITDEVKLNADKGTRLAASKKEGGTIWVNGENGRLPDLITKQDFGDCEVHVEFLIAKNSNSGIKFHAVYEIQIFDSYGKKNLTGEDMGGIYPRADDSMGYKHLDKGIGPKVNASKPAGEWQTLDAVWKSPRVDVRGEKITNAVMVKAVLNGEVIHANVDVKTPTGSNWTKKETASGPFMLQCDHGPVAFRNVRIKPAEKKKE
jgi:hypothetical protein